MTGFLLNIKLETGGRKMTLNDYSKRYETILNLPLSVIEKDKMLSSLMSDLERAYRIPMIKNEVGKRKTWKSMLCIFKFQCPVPFNSLASPQKKTRK